MPTSLTRKNMNKKSSDNDFTIIVAAFILILFVGVLLLL